MVKVCSRRTSRLGLSSFTAMSRETDFKRKKQEGGTRQCGRPLNPSVILPTHGYTLHKKAVIYVHGMASPQLLVVTVERGKDVAGQSRVQCVSTLISFLA